MAGDIGCTLPQRVKEDDGILIGCLNLLGGQSDGKIELLCKGVKDPLVEYVRVCAAWQDQNGKEE